MKNNFIISEEERKSILGLHESAKRKNITEQTSNSKGNKAIQCFLNKKGFKVQITGDINSETKKAIQNFQTKAKLSPANGNWNDTVNNLTPQDKLEIEIELK